ncbi:Hypothetical protein FKW44_010795 [Caligus rogercresseyi]|uniref:Uncharacterized protein n=1 Tax=Caligus rogercresseyi TaxID=217165 RepID=A0A7T8K9T7_CALRO|nr:Hypothetical protein FKW44_010795 [Caligus rogercresseyi]
MPKEEYMSTTSIWRLISQDLRMLAYKKKPLRFCPSYNEHASYPWEENYSTALQKYVAISSLDR